MRLIAVLMVAVLVGCAHTPWGYNFTRDGDIPKEYRADKSHCHNASWADAKEEVGTTLNDVFLYLFEKKMLACMKDKGYKRVNDAARIHNLASHQEIQVGRQ
ncbi:hypothetical protein SAMN05216420_101405 [Nitrosospira sp. Nl5]|nr:hypothetical protein SAMN05216420_101405 [Nitrosospira sp. Nl5]